jgi:hypothetical protein
VATSALQEQLDELRGAASENSIGRQIMVGDAMADVVRAKRFALVDDAGKTRALLSRSPALSLWDADGNVLWQAP